MNSRVKLLQVAGRVGELAAEMGGVFSSSDLSSIIGGGSDLVNFRLIGKLVRDGVLYRVQRGIYTVKDCDLWMLAARLSSSSYISMDSVLARNGLTGTIPVNSVSVVHLARNKIIRSVSGNIYFHSISSGLFFGFTKLACGVSAADSEKAFLDLIYYYVKGVRFAIDPLSEIMLQRLDKKKLASYLKRYRNPKFVKFVKGMVYEK